MEGHRFHAAFSSGGVFGLEDTLDNCVSAMCGALSSRPVHDCVQQILDKDEFTLEDLLEEDDIIQECKSLNGRLVAL